MIHFDPKPWKLQPAVCGEPSAHGRTTTASPKMVTCDKCIEAMSSGRRFTCGGCGLPYTSNVFGPGASICPRCNPGETANEPEAQPYENPEHSQECALRYITPEDATSRDYGCTCNAQGAPDAN